jgi:branched-chain amino acid transport system ATP-binding protein
MSYALELKDLRKNFGKTEIIRGVNLAVNAGERIAIIGPNGAGKSTLFNLISGRFGPSSGEILLNGHRTKLTAWVCLAVSKLPIFFQSSVSLKT